MIEGCSSKVTRQVEMPSPSSPSTLRRTAFDCRLSANGTAAVTRRSPGELRTICTVTLGPLKRKQMPVYAHGLLWIPRLFSRVGIGSQKFFGGGGRPPGPFDAPNPQDDPPD